jgi:hypothetical protein
VRTRGRVAPTESAGPDLQRCATTYGILVCDGCRRLRIGLGEVRARPSESVESDGDPSCDPNVQEARYGPERSDLRFAPLEPDAQASLPADHQAESHHARDRMAERACFTLPSRS